MSSVNKNESINNQEFTKTGKPRKKIGRAHV